jgi:hypothetical protein
MSFNYGVEKNNNNKIKMFLHIYHMFIMSTLLPSSFENIEKISELHQCILHYHITNDESRKVHSTLELFTSTKV